MVEPVVLAFGGHALLSGGDDASHGADLLAGAIKALMPKRAGMVLVHGNGPQVGMILLRMEATRDMIPPEPLDVLVAETQGSIGYLLARSIRSALGEGREVAAVLTQVVVDPKEPAFIEPTKPVGPCYSLEQAKDLKSRWRMVKARKGWRRVVPSPRPVEVVEIHTIEDAVGHGHLLIAGGGGGIPVFKDQEGRLSGVEAVVDKDYTAALLAVALNAGSFIIVTDVSQVSRGFGTAGEFPIPVMEVAEAKDLLAAGEFPPGSMGPKVEGAARYAEATGKPALITDLEHLEEALEGAAGTWVVPFGGGWDDRI